MFRRKKPRKRLRVEDARGKIVFEDELTSLEVPEDVVLRLSETFFNDPCPCEIHRGAVLSRVFAELEEALSGRGVCALDDLPQDMRAYFGAYDARSVSLREEAQP